jgi:tetratricopeptide (TPR) repeat protein
MDTPTVTLQSYHLPPPRCEAIPLSATLRPIWRALQAGQWRAARTLLRASGGATTGEQAALSAARARVEQALGNTKKALRWIERSRELAPRQWFALRLHCDILGRRHAHAEATALLAAQPLDAPAWGLWDEPLPPAAYHTALAAWAFRQQARSTAREHLHQAYPSLDAMPPGLLHDLFRLCVNTEQQEGAVAAARQLITPEAFAASDALLQALVDQGWEKAALRLYLTLDAPGVPADALRRRIVGLCLRTGAVEKARAYHAAP